MKKTQRTYNFKHHYVCFRFQCQCHGLRELFVILKNYMFIDIYVYTYIYKMFFMWEYGWIVYIHIYVGFIYKS